MDRITPNRSHFRMLGAPLLAAAATLCFVACAQPDIYVEGEPELGNISGGTGGTGAGTQNGGNSNTGNTNNNTGGSNDAGAKTGDASVDAAAEGGATGATGASDAATDAGARDAADNATINGCLILGTVGTAFVDRRNGDRTIKFSENNTPQPYSVPCMLIKTGQRVEWEGDFERYPLQAKNGATPSPIETTDDGDDEDFKFNTAGVYGFFSPAQPTVMLGAIKVVP